MNFIIQTLMGRLQKTNPQAFQFINSAISNNGDPGAMLSQILSRTTPEQRQNLITQAKNYGCPENYLKQIQNLK